MNRISPSSLALSLPLFALASCANADSGDSAPASATGSDGAGFTVNEMGTFAEPWAIEFAPGTDMLFITEKAGVLKAMNTKTGVVSTVSGTPEVFYAGQGGLGDVAFVPGEANGPLDGRTIYLSWAEAGDKGTSGAAVGRGTLSCDEAGADCAVEGLEVIWRQSLKTGRRGHYSHRLAFSPDGKHLFIASGERQEGAPAQDLTNNLGTIVRLALDGTPAQGNPFADQGAVQAQIWSYGHRNILGMDWDAAGRLWEIEHGPAGGDELNVVERAANYGWPKRSYGNEYNGADIPDHTADDGFAKPAIHWTPVIAPGDMIIYSGEMFAAWKGQALIAGLQSQGLVRVELDGKSGREAARYPLGGRMRSIEQGPDGSLWIAADGKDARLLKLTAK
jgi:glucose/arabinose dehydrogenase